MKTIAKEKIDILESVVFDEDGVRRLDISTDGFRVCALAAHPIEKGEEVEFIFKTNKDFLLPEIKTKERFCMNNKQKRKYFQIIGDCIETRTGEKLTFEQGKSVLAELWDCVNILQVAQQIAPVKVSAQDAGELESNKELLKEFVEKMEECAKNGNATVAHDDADNLLCDFLCKLGCGELVEKYLEVKQAGTQ